MNELPKELLLGIDGFEEELRNLTAKYGLNQYLVVVGEPDDQDDSSYTSFTNMKYTGMVDSVEEILEHYRNVQTEEDDVL